MEKKKIVETQYNASNDLDKASLVSTGDGINRRDFLKIAGASAVGGMALATLGGCDTSVQVGSESRGQMTYRVNPKNGDSLSLLGFGMMRLPQVPRLRGESLPDVNDIDQDAVNELVDYAIEHGVNVFDTASAYGKGFSETVTGIALSRHPRDKFFISTKLSNQRGDARRTEESKKIYYNSFEKLQVDYIDYYFCHNIGSREAFNTRFKDNGMLDFLLKEKEKGKIRQLGFSFHGDGAFFEQITKEYPWDFAMIQLNFLDWNHIMGWTNITAQRQYEILCERNIPVWVMEPLLGGGLANPHYLARARMMQENPNVSAPSWAFRFVGSLPNVVTILSGMTFMDHLVDNVNTFSPLIPLYDSERQMISDISEIMLEKRALRCTFCQYCMPCPYGIDIPEIFKHYNKCLNEGNYPDNYQSENYKKARRAFLIGLDRAVDPMRQANRCINCRQCMGSCPQRINIPGELRRIDGFVEALKRGV